MTAFIAYHCKVYCAVLSSVMKRTETEEKRSVSCGKVWTPTSDGRGGVETTQVSLSSLHLPAKRKISFDVIDDKPFRKKKKNHIRPSTDEPNLSFSKMIPIVSLIGAVGGMIVAFVSYASNKNCDKLWDHSNLIEDLSITLHGQSYAIAKFNYTLNDLHFYAHPLLFTVIGDVGVGKSFFVNKVIDFFPWQRQVGKYPAKDLPFVTLDKVFSSCGFNLLVIEDCNSQNFVPVLDTIERFIIHAGKNKVKLIVMLVCTKMDDSDIRDIRLINSDFVDVVNLSMEPLDRDAILRCFKDVIKNENIQIGDYDLFTIVDEYYEESKNAGCKQVLTKLIASNKIVQ